MFRKQYKKSNQSIHPSRELLLDTKRKMLEEWYENEFKETTINKDESCYQIDLSKQKTHSWKKATSIVAGFASCFILIGGLFYLTHLNRTPDSNVVHTVPSTSPVVTAVVTPTEVVNKTDLDNLDLTTPVKFDHPITGQIAEDHASHTIRYEKGILYIDKMSLNIADQQESAHTDYFYVIDMDTSDSYYELLFESDGPSDDPSTTIVRFVDGKIINMGAVPNYITDMTFDNNGAIKTIFRLDVLQTGYAYGSWAISKNNTIEHVTQKMYQIYHYEDPAGEDRAITLKVALPLYKSATKTSKTFTMNPQKVRFVQTDGEHWIEVKGETDQISGWLYFSDFDYIDALNTEANNIFDNLLYAD